LPHLLPLPRDRGRVFRLRPRARAAAGAVAHLWRRPAGADPAQGVPRERRAAARALTLLLERGRAGGRRHPYRARSEPSLRGSRSRRTSRRSPARLLPEIRAWTLARD